MTAETGNARSLPIGQSVLADPGTAASFPLTIPGPRPMFLLGWRGNVLQCARDPLRYLTSLHKTYGDVAALVRGGNRNLLSKVAHCPGTVVVFGPRYNEAILGNPDLFHMSLVTGLEGTSVEHLGAGMFNTNGSTHKQLRHEAAPAFRKKWNETYHEPLVSLTRQTLDTWERGQCRDLLEEMNCLIFRIIWNIFFRLDAIEEIDSFGRLTRQWVKMGYAPATRLFAVDLPFTPYRRFLRISRRLDQHIAALVRRKQTDPGEEEDLFGAILRASDPDRGFLTEAECFGQVLSLLIGAHETTAVALTWTLFLLTQHPQVMAELAEELEGSLQGEAPSLEQLARLPLLENVVRESLRLLPPVPFAGRVTAGPTELGPHHLPCGTEVLYSQYVTHRLPEMYPQPARFLPNRWFHIKPSPYEYLPFGAGPRRCLGAQLAMSQIKTVLVMVVQRYRLQLPPRARVDRLIRLTLMPRRGMPVVVGSQDHRFGDSKTDVRGNIREMVDFS